MRLWHKDLIHVLPKQQLLGQWRECCCIARNIAVDGTPNHLLVNKVMEYPLAQFYNYGLMVAREMSNKGYKVDRTRFTKYFPLAARTIATNLFEGWHNDRYFNQCYYNLQEKYDCGGIPQNEWKVIEGGMQSLGFKKYSRKYVTELIKNTEEMEGD